MEHRTCSPKDKADVTTLRNRLKSYYGRNSDLAREFKTRDAVNTLRARLLAFDLEHRVRHESCTADVLLEEEAKDLRSDVVEAERFRIARGEDQLDEVCNDPDLRSDFEDEIPLKGVAVDVSLAAVVPRVVVGQRDCGCLALELYPLHEIDGEEETRQATTIKQWRRHDDDNREATTTLIGIKGEEKRRDGDSDSNDKETRRDNDGVLKMDGKEERREATAMTAR
ncbi:hypothetical protein Droror1_Dr00024855 [Drosera rotundifolia]